MRSLVLIVLGWALPLAAGPLYESLVHRIQAEKIQRLEDALRRVPAEQFTHYTLMYASRSAQDASPEAPRAIVYGKDGKSILTFNGSTSQKGGDRLELMEWRESEARFELSSIVFPTAKNKLSRPAFLPHPESCRHCHGEDPHPIWAPYSEWPGAYGRDDDEPKFDEKTNFLAFRATMTAHPRYRFLPLESAHPVTPYLDRNKGHLHFRPNFYLLLLLNRYQARRLGRRIQESPEGAVLAPLLAAASAGCGGLDAETVSALTPYLSPHIQQLAVAEGMGYWEKLLLGDYVGHRARILPEDWTMQKQTPGRNMLLPLAAPFSEIPGYRFSDATTELTHLVADAIFRRLGVPGHRTNAYFDYYRPETEETITVDALGGELRADRELVCPILVEKVQRAMRTQRWGDKPPAASWDRDHDG